MDALEDLRKGFAALEVGVAIVRSLRQTMAAVVDADEVLVRALGRPTGTDRQGRVELAFDFTDVETARGSFARRQNWFTEVIDATPCALLLWQ